MQEMFEDTKTAIRSRKSKIPKRQSEKSKKDKQYNGHKIPKGQSEERQHNGHDIMTI